MICSSLTPYLGIAATIALSRIIERSVVDKTLLLLISASSYIIYLFHTTFEGFAKALVMKLPYLSNIGNDVAFAIGAIFVVGCGNVIPIVLSEIVLKRYKVTRMLLGLK